jgi:hypothetical protein
MHKSATKCNEIIGKWCKNKHGASKIIDTLETYQPLPKINDADLKKVKKEGFLAQSAEIVFPGDKVIPRPPDGFRVMFLSFHV